MPTTAPSKNGILRDVCAGRIDEFKVDPDIIIVPKGWNPRDFTTPENKEHLAGVKASLKEVGQKHALLITTDGDKIILEDGETRLRAIKELRAEGIPFDTVLVKKAQAADPEQRLINTLTGNTGKPLTKLELGEAFSRFIKWNWDVPRIAHELGYYSEAFITQALEQ